MPFEVARVPPKIRGCCPNHMFAIVDVVTGGGVERRWMFGAWEGSEEAYGFQGEAYG